MNVDKCICFVTHTTIKMQDNSTIPEWPLVSFPESPPFLQATYVQIDPDVDEPPWV